MSDWYSNGGEAEAVREVNGGGDRYWRRQIQPLPLQHRLGLAGVVKGCVEGETGETTTGEAYEFYEKVAAMVDVDMVTERRRTGIYAELDDRDVINGEVVSRGRYGRTRVMEPVADPDRVWTVLRETEKLECLPEQPRKPLEGVVRDVNHLPTLKRFAGTSPFSR